jgi:hypothetical protein
MHTRHYMYNVGRSRYTIDDAVALSEKLILRDYRRMDHMFHIQHENYTLACLSYCHHENEWSLVAYTNKPSIYKRLL